MPEPTFQAILVVDIEGFGRRTHPVQRELRTAMYQVVRTAFEDAGLDPDRIHREDRGDGILMLDPDASVLRLAGRFIRSLDDALREKAKMSSPMARMRLRVALHQGLCEHDGEGWVGDAVNKAFRLVDTQPLKDVLATATRAQMAFIVSDEIYDGVIRHDYRSVDSSVFGRVLIDAKELRREPVWIQAPGYPYPPGLPSPTPAEPSPAPHAVPDPEPTQAAASGPPAGQSGGISFNNSDVRVRGDIVNSKTVNRGRR